MTHEGYYRYFYIFTKRQKLFASACTFLYRKYAQIVNTYIYLKGILYFKFLCIEISQLKNKVYSTQSASFFTI